MTNNSPPPPPPPKPPFLDNLGRDLTIGRQALLAKRRRRTYMGAITAVLVVLGGVVAVTRASDEPLGQEAATDIEANVDSEAAESQTVEAEIVNAETKDVETTGSETTDSETTGSEVGNNAEPQPQAESGEGWRLLFNQRAGTPYVTWVATTWDHYDELIDRLDPGASWPDDVDFEEEIVIWFGAVFSGSCPDIRLDQVVIERQAALVYADIVQNVQTVEAGQNQTCTSDANPRAYVVAVDRAVLPETPFVVQLSAEEGPGCCIDQTKVMVTAGMLDGTEDPPPLEDRLGPTDRSGQGRTTPLDIAEQLSALTEATVVVDIYSGLPNPTIKATQSHRDAVGVALLSLDEANEVPPPQAHLGLRGVSLSAPGMSVYATPTTVTLSTDDEDEVTFADPTGSVLLAIGEPVPALLSDSNVASALELLLFSTREQLIGMNEVEAIEIIEGQGYAARVVERDGQQLGGDDDLRSDRFNLTVEDQAVTKISFG